MSCGPRLPKIYMPTLHFLSAKDCIHRFRNGTLTPIDYLESVFAAAHEQQPSINAATNLYIDQARTMAMEAGRRYKDGTARPLEGVPVIIKEETAVKGWPRTLGSVLYKDEVADENHPIVDKLLEAGAIPYFQATTPEFCVLGHTWTKQFGVTRNPWSLAHSCGGSSGGTGAALAAGVAPIGTGSDMGGSIRLPASLCGVYGFKPPFGRVPCGSGDEFFAQATEGPMARTIEDLILMQNVIAGPHPGSYATVPFTPLPEQYDDLKGVRIGYCPALGTLAVDGDVVRNMDRAVEGLRRRGAEIVPVDIQWDMDAIGTELIDGILAIFFGESLREISDAQATELCSYTQHLRNDAKNKPVSVTKSAELAARLHAEMHAKVWSQGCSAFVCATMLTTDLPADQDPVANPTLQINGHPVSAYLGWALTPPFNLLNRYPVIAAPTGLSDIGVPTGMQIVTNSFQDEMAFRVAYNHARAGTSDLFIERFPKIG